MISAGFLRERLERIRQRSLIIGAAASLLCLAGAYFNSGQFYRSYLVAYLFWCGIAVGCLGLLMLHHLVAGGWGFVIQRLLESAARTFPLLALLFIPLLFGLKELYPWARPDLIAADSVLRHQSQYLNSPFFILRAILYLAVWIGMGHLLVRWSIEQDRSGDPALGRRLQSFSGPGLLIYALTVTFSSVDWMMSLEPKWYSAIFGMMFMVGHGLAALAFALAGAFLLAKEESLSRISLPGIFHDLGNLLLAFVMLWAYMAFSQFLVIWSGNLVEEIPWYLSRTRGGWGAIAIFLLLFQFAVPFLALLSRSMKRRASSLAMVALGILFICFVHLFWIVAPAFAPDGLRIHWMDLMAPAGIGGIWIATLLTRLKGEALLPLGDSRLAGILAKVERT